MTDETRFLPMAAAGRAAAAPPVFERVAILGLGLIGGSIALAARERWPGSLVIGVDAKDVLERAMVLHAIDVGADDPVVVAEADLVILAAPVRENLALLKALPEHVQQAAVVTDTGSTKRATAEAARALPERLVFIGGHPLGGSARGGIEHARADLFVNRPWLFTPEGDGGGDALDRLFLFASGLGAKPRVVGLADHDRMMAYLSHLPQLTASALMQIVGDGVGEAGLGLAGRGLVDTTRLASSPAGIWRDIAATNATEIRRALDGLISVLETLRDDLEQGDRIEEVFDAAHQWRALLRKDGE